MDLLVDVFVRGHAGGNKNSITVSTNTVRNKVEHMTMMKLKKDLQVQKELDIGPAERLMACMMLEQATALFCPVLMLSRVC